jgi:uncharacterized protein YndB with AHSA1/START domain
MADNSTQVSGVIKASRSVVYDAFLDGEVVASWLSPDTMTGHVHSYEPYIGGKFRISLTTRIQAIRQAESH